MSDLMKQAKKARPAPEQVERHDYDEIYPVYETLRQGGFGPAAAVDWLIEKGAIPLERRTGAYRALANRWARRGA